MLSHPVCRVDAFGLSVKAVFDQCIVLITIFNFPVCVCGGVTQLHLISLPLFPSHQFNIAVCASDGGPAAGRLAAFGWLCSSLGFWCEKQLVERSCRYPGSVN